MDLQGIASLKGMSLLKDVICITLLILMFKGIAPFLWPFVLLSLSVALTPISPLSWSYSTWLLFIIPLVLTVFAPTRTFSGPLRYAYLEYASKVTAFLLALLGNLFAIFQSLPTVALPALFFLPMLPLLLFIFFPALPLAWHYIAYHYRRRLETVTASASRTTTRLELAVARARRATALVHTYEKEALGIVSTTRRTASITLALHSTDFFDTSVSAWSALGHTTARIEDIATATSDVVKSSNDLRQCESPDDEIRPGVLAEILFDRANIAVAAVSEAERLARQAQESVSRSKNAISQAQEARQKVHSEAERMRTLGVKLADTVMGVETKVVIVEDEAEEARALLEKVIAVAVEGEMVAAEALAVDAANSLESVVRQAGELCSVAEVARQIWVELSVHE